MKMRKMLHLESPTHSSKQLQTDDKKNLLNKKRENVYGSIAAIPVILAMLAAMPVVFAQAEISFTPFKEQYSVGDRIEITGIANKNFTNSLTITILNPDQRVCYTETFDVDEDGSFSTDPVQLSGNECGMVGLYVVHFYDHHDFVYETTFRVVDISEEYGRLLNFLEILESSSERIEAKLTDIQNRNIVVHEDLIDSYDLALLGIEAARDSLNRGDIQESKEHLKESMNILREVFVELTQLEANWEEIEQDEEANTKDLNESNELLFNQTITRLVDFRQRLYAIAGSHDIPLNFSNVDNSLRSADMYVREGDYDKAVQELSLTRDMLNEIHDHLVQEAKEKKRERMQQYLLLLLNRLELMADKAEAMGLSEEVANIQDARTKLLEARKTADIRPVAEEISQINNRISIHSNRIFESMVSDLMIKIELAEAKTDKHMLSLSFDPVHYLVAQAEARWDLGDEETAHRFLAQAWSELTVKELMIEEAGKMLFKLDRISEAAENLKSNASNNDSRMIVIVSRALTLADRAEETVRNADAIEDIESAQEMYEEAIALLRQARST